MQDHIISETEPKRLCFQLLKDINAIAGRMHGSTTSKKVMLNKIWLLVSFLGAPSWYIMLSPADIQHPLCVYYAGTQTESRPIIVPYDDHMRSVCANPVASAWFFHFMVETFIADVLGINASHHGFYSDTGGYYSTVEQQGHLMLHLHMLLWIKGNINLQEMREKNTEKWFCMAEETYRLAGIMPCGWFFKQKSLSWSGKEEKKKAK